MTSNQHPYGSVHQPAPVARQGNPAGWYGDPIRPGQRYFDGLQWTAHTAPAGTYPLVRLPAATPVVAPPPAPAPAVSVNTTVQNVVVLGRRKSVAAAFLLTLLFGPLGMLYSTVGGALLMMVISVGGAVVLGAVTFGIGGAAWLAFCWFIAIIWGCAAAA